MTFSEEVSPAARNKDLHASDFDAAFLRIEANQRAEEELFTPSPVIEHLLWQVCGAWETVIEDVRFTRYTVAAVPPINPPFFRPDGGNVARDMRRIAHELNLRLPSDTIWTAECKRAKEVRDHLGHMLHFKSVEGTTPNQSVTLLRVQYGEPDEMSTSASGGLARHNRRTVTITEQDAREVLADLHYINACLFALRKFGMDFAIRRDDRTIEDALEIMPWWLDDWGPKPGAPGWKSPTMRQLRIQPKREYDASLPPEMRPEF